MTELHTNLSKRELIKRLSKLGAEWDSADFWDRFWKLEVNPHLLADLAAKLTDQDYEGKPDKHADRTTSLDTLEFFPSKVGSEYNEELEELIERAVSQGHSTRDAAIWARYHAGETKREIARDIGVSHTLINRIVSRVAATVSNYVSYGDGSWYGVFLQSTRQTLKRDLPIRQCLESEVKCAREYLEGNPYNWDTAFWFDSEGRMSNKLICTLPNGTNHKLTTAGVVNAAIAYQYADYLRLQGLSATVIISDTCHDHHTIKGIRCKNQNGLIEELTIRRIKEIFHN